MGSLSEGSKWHDISCDEKLRFVCQYDETTGNCDGTERNASCYEGKFYNISDTTKSYTNAKQFCTNTGGALLTVRSEGVKNFTLDLMRINSPPKLNKYVSKLFQEDNFWGWFLQIIAVHSQLTIIIGLCMDNGDSITSKFLRTKAMQFLGSISLALYLLHDAVMGFVELAINGPHDLGTEEEIWEAWEDGSLDEPPGTPLIIIVVSIIFSYFMTKYFDEPVSKVLRGDK